MKKIISRRNFLGVVGAAATSGVVSASAGTEKKDLNSKRLIVGISCSPRKGKTTSQSVQVALEAAKKTDPKIETKLIDLGGMDIPGWTGAKDVVDDFSTKLEPALRAPNLGGIIIGSPVYYRCMSALCKAFLERLAILRKPKLLLQDKAVGALAVGAYRNGGQELVIEQIHSAMLCHEAMCVGGKSPALQGATLWNAYKDDISKDEYGMDSAKNLGIRVAEAAIRLSV